ncbi:MAG: aminotransferase class I/II-fold pyridoxal phosphate-dependent enzyme [Candidatus Diapherotrites archaeon]|nr:aminotransferase class I/II-fold pyridoxal phosphate-dependent enzyme [Candidatus Diapherotrites archaeon]
MSNMKLKFDSKAIHAGESKGEHKDAVVVPIYQTSNFSFPSVEEAEARFQLKKQGYVYTRGRNPTVEVLEKKMAELEGGDKAIALSSGMAAISTLALSLLKKGDHALCSDVVYRSTWELFHDLLPKFGVETSLVDTSNPELVKNALKPNTKLIFIETPCNPTMKLSDIQALAKLAHEHNALLVVDNTFMTPYFQKPLKLGADIVVHSMTKFLNGHSDALGGVIVCPEKLHAQLWEDLCIIGGTLDPFAAWLILRGMKTLGVRMKKHEENALRMAKFLESHPKVLAVNYPGLESFPQHKLAEKQMSGFGGMISFRVKGGEKAARKLVNNVKLVTLGVSLGGVESLIEHSTTMVHSSMSREEQESVGITPDLIRISVGLEDADDLIADLKQALSKI